MDPPGLEARREARRREDRRLRRAVAAATLDSVWDVAYKLSEGGAYDLYLVDDRGQMIAHSNPARFSDG